MVIARLADGAIAEQRHLALDDVPEHKRSQWLPVEGDQPEFVAALETCEGPSLEVDGNVVRRVWTVTPRPLAEQQAAVKIEARRRILARYPEWKQANMTARAVELVPAFIAGTLTQQELDEVAALNAAWAWIKEVRSTSDALEALADIPRDFVDDKWWPA